MTRSEWLEAALAAGDDSQLKRAMVELHPLIGSKRVQLMSVGELRERLRAVDDEVHVCVVWAPSAIDSPSDT